VSKGPGQLLITRFNVQLHEGSTKPGIRDEWLLQRLPLFETICAPSVARQAGPTRPWLVLIDSDTPDWARRRIAAAGNNCDLRLVEVIGQINDQRIGEIASSHWPEGTTDTLITSRLDNDDAISDRYLEIVFTIGVERGPGLLNARHGFQMTNNRLYRLNDPKSPFLTMVETRSIARPPITAFCVPHWRASEFMSVHQIASSGLWVQTLHGDNIANNLRGRRVKLEQLDRGFPHLRHATEETSLGFRLDQLLTTATSLGYSARSFAGSMRPRR
jgi:hypothetical protein